MRNKWLRATVSAWMLDAFEVEVIRRVLAPGVLAPGVELQLGDELRDALVRLRRRLLAKPRRDRARRVPATKQVRVRVKVRRDLIA